MPYTIGVFDSGLGGLTVYKELKAHFPNSKFAYLSDSKRCPYGVKSDDSIIEICKSNIRFFENLQVKKIFIACHTASTIAFDSLKNFANIEIIPIHITTGNYLLNLPHKSSLLILGTDSTVKNGYYQNLLRNFRKDLSVKAIACPFLVEYIQNQIDDPLMLEDILNSYGISRKFYDYILLACTHFPIVSDVMKKKVSSKTIIINPALLLAQELNVPSEELFTYTPDDDFFVHGPSQEFDHFTSKYLKRSIYSKKVSIENSVII